jgi:hypothetical protein
MNPSVKYGLLVSATGILISLLVFVVGLDKSDTGQYLGWLNIPIMIVCMVLAIKESRQKLGGFISFGPAFKTVAVMVLISAVITSLYTYFYFTSINPSIVEYIKDKQYMEFQDQGMSDEEIDAAMAMSGKFMTPGIMTLFTLLGGVALGLIVGAIVAAIVKKPDPSTRVS